MLRTKPINRTKDVGRSGFDGVLQKEDGATGTELQPYITLRWQLTTCIRRMLY